MRIVWQFFRVFGRRATYDPRRNYFLFVGFLAGLAAPAVSLWTHLYALEYHYSLWQILARHPFHWAFMAVPFVFAVIFGGLGAVRINRVARLSELVRRLSELSTTDELTGLANARHLQAQLDDEVNRAERHRSTFSLVLLDLDGFKRVNDTRGHPNGDVALREVARLIRSCRRRYDTVARYGGDEFAVVLPGAHQEDALRIASRARATLAEHGFLATHSAGPCTITASFGVATYPQDGVDKPALVAAADRALYLAKSRGRNMVCAAGETTTADATGAAPSPREPAPVADLEQPTPR